MKKQTLYFVLFPARQVAGLGEIMIIGYEKIARELAEDIGGAYVPSSFGLN